jgi:putative ABC transport system permease protein
MQGILQDMKHAVRILAKNPGFTSMAVLMLAVGIGVNTLIFSVIDALFLRSMPVRDPKQLVWINANKQSQPDSFSYSDYQDLCRSKSFADIIAVSSKGALLERNGEIEMVSAEWVSENYFSVLGVKPAMGLAFDESGQWNPSENPPVIISHGLWQKRFGSDPNIIGKTIVVNKRYAVVRGVAPASFIGLKMPMVIEIWIPFKSWAGGRELQSRNFKNFDKLLGRLNPNTTIKSARAELDIIARQLALAYPATNQGASYSANSVEKSFLDFSLYIVCLLIGPFLFLMICCANITGMGLAKAEERRNEIAVRLALGSSSRRLLRQLFTENLLLALAGAALGLILTSWLIRLPSVLMPPLSIDIRLDLRVDWRVLLFTLAISATASFVSGIAPALQAFKSELSTMLKGKTGATDGAKHSLGLRSILITSQVAVALTMIIATGLFVKSLFLSMQIDPGFDPNKKLLIVNVAPMMNSRENRQKFFDPVLDQIKFIPGVKHATYAMRVLLSDSGGATACEVSIPGVENPKGQKGYLIKYNSVGMDYFRTVGTRMHRGREFSESDEFPGQRTVIISETMAKRFWPKSDAIGSFITRDGVNYQIIGVAQDGSISDLHEKPESYIYFSIAQIPAGECAIIVETTRDPLDYAAAVRSKIQSVDKSTVILYTSTLEKVMAMAFYVQRITVLATGVLGALGIIITAVGLYGIVSYLARRRTHEIGIRIALGATFSDIFRLVIAKGFRMSLIGIAAGLVISIFAMRLISSALYGVAPNDIWIFSISALLVLAVALLASFIPARRAAKIHPAVALRYE